MYPKPVSTLSDLKVCEIPLDHHILPHLGIFGPQMSCKSLLDIELTYSYSKSLCIALISSHGYIHIGQVKIHIVTSRCAATDTSHRLGTTQGAPHLQIRLVWCLPNRDAPSFYMVHLFPKINLEKPKTHSRPQNSSKLSRLVQIPP